MANKMFKELQAFRKNVKKLPKDIREAYSIEQTDDVVKIFIVDKIEESTSEMNTVYFIEKCNTENEPLSFEIELSKECCENEGIIKGMVFEKLTTSFVTSLCPAMITIGKILKQNVLPDVRYVFYDDEIFGQKITKFKHITKEEYENDLYNSMIVFRKKINNI